MSMMLEVEKLMQSINLPLNYRTINLDGKQFYIEGIKSVVSLDLTEMIFQLKKAVISVKGSNLKVKYLDKTTCLLQGEIRAVEVK